MNIVYLQISGGKGTSIGAVHYYGLLVCRENSERKTTRLTKKITAALAKDLNWKHWEEGDVTERFRSKDQLIHLARQTWKEHFPNGTILVQGRSAIAEPQTVLEGPKELKRKINALVAEVKALERQDDFERLGDFDWDTMDDICRRWDEIIKEKKMLEIGKKYRVEHQRKGTFKMRIVEDGKVWVTGIITEGEARSRRGWREVGEDITVRKSFATFEALT